MPKSTAHMYLQHLSCHRLTKWFALEGTFEDHLIQTPCHGQRHLSLDYVAQSPIQPDLEHFQ